MTNISTAISDLPPEQQAIRDKCFHPTGKFIEFKKEEIEQSIPDRFEQVVRKYPDRLAVRTKTRVLTYEELNTEANRLAHAILAQRGEREEPIALLLDNDASIIAAIFGVLKAGKICVPLDPAYPRARIATMLEDSQADLIVGNRENLSLAVELARNVHQSINIDEIHSSLSTENPGVSLSPDNLSYLFYTSGSTGKPKGIFHNHRNYLHCIRDYTNAFHIGAEDRLTLLHSCSFAASVPDIFCALLNSASVHVWNFKVDGFAGLATWFTQEEITVCNWAATPFRHWMDSLTGETHFPRLRLIIMNSEPVSKREVELYKWYFSPDCILVNRLGTTETNTFRQYFVDKRSRIEGSSVPSGYTVVDKKVLLLDDAHKEVGINCIGEIAVKSPYISLGYWRKPEATDAAFLPDPSGGSERIYFTGDLGRMMPDGCLLHLGRKDFQVKIRGYRVEVAEIEMVLLEHAAVKEAVVVTREDSTGQKRLVAYFVSTRQPSPSISELRNVLNQKLPDYMIPSTFVRVEAMPLTPSGKLDRLALRSPSSDRPELAVLYAAPETPVEKELAKIWAELLSLDQVGVHDNFLDLGGNSLLATQIISRVINAFRVELSVKSLFESPTVADMAVVITENMAKKAGDKELARMLTELESLSDEEAQRLLAEEGK